VDNRVHRFLTAKGLRPPRIQRGVNGGIEMKRHRNVCAVLFAVIALGQANAAIADGFAEARIYIEYNSTARDLGFHVSLDGEDWRSLRIQNPDGLTIFEVKGKKGYRELGMTELFFEGAEPALSEFPLEDLLALFPAGYYRFSGRTVDGTLLSSLAKLSHAVPDGPRVSSEVNGDAIVIRWDPVTGPPPDFPDAEIEITGYQVIVDTFEVTLPATSTSLTLPVEFVHSLEAGVHQFEVLAIDESGNQTITEGSFNKL